MPLYEYQCDACGCRFELIQRYTDPPAEICTSCGASPVRKLFSSPAIQFKGSGWYITDYARKDQKSDQKSDAQTDAAGAGDAAATDKAGKDKPAGEKTAKDKTAKDKSTAEDTSTASAGTGTGASTPASASSKNRD
jgi:putative FmdB family regulatory protein